MLEIRVLDGLCILRLQSPPLNMLTLALLETLRGAVQQTRDDPSVAAIVITGDAQHFSAGADVNLFQEIRTASDAIRISRFFQEVFQEIEDSPKPVVAALAGTVVGGALELAMACHGRVAATGTRFRMPEVTLGINPGAGGTQRLPRLVGLDASLRMLLSAETLEAEQALALGLIDAVCPGDRLVQQCGEWLRSGRLAPPDGGASTSPGRTCQRTDKLADAGGRAAEFQQAQQLLAKVRPEIIAPGKIVEAVRVGVEESVPAGLRREQQAFAECMSTLAAQNKIYLFFATSQTGKLPELAGVEAALPARAAVVGMGTMGTGIAHAFAQSGVPVLVLDENPAAVQKGLDRIRNSVQKRVQQGKMAPEQAEQMLQSVTPASRWEDLAQADVIVESVFEDVAVKRSVLGRLETLGAPDAILASNTSTISLDDLAAGLRHPERLIGLHFFNPAQRMPLVEIIRRPQTDPAVLAAAVKLAKRLRKTAVVVANREGFLVNRLFVPYLQEAFWLLEEGATAAAIDAAAVDFGFPMGPLALIDMAGLDILVHAHNVLRRAFPLHGPLSGVATRLVERGHLGQKTGSGVYRYEPRVVAPQENAATGEIVAQVQREQGRVPRRVQPREIAERLVLRMVNEAFYLMAEGVALRESDVDVAMVLGTGFPDFRGGVLKYAHDLGLAAVLSRLEDLSRRGGERFAPSQRLRHAAK